MSNNQLPAIKPKYSPWNKGRLIGQKRPLLAKQVWAIRARLELAGNLRDLALFNLAIDSKLRGGDLVRERVSVIQSKTQRPVQFEVSEGTRDSIWNWVCSLGMLVVTYPKTSHVNALLRLLRYTPRKRQTETNCETLGCFTPPNHLKVQHFPKTVPYLRF